MKKFVFFASCIKDMGGAQMYHRNKCVYMQEQGWVVDLVSAQRGKVYIPELQKYDLIIPEIGFDYYLFSRSKREKIVKLLVDRIKDNQYDEILIESSCIQESTWAEVVAKRCGAKHYCYILQEYNPINSHTIQEFVKFKHKRNELAGITPKSLYDMFLPFSPISKEESYWLPAYCNNVVEDIENELVERIQGMKHDFIVGCLSRLDKPFIMSALTDFLNYTKDKNKQYILLLIGGAPAGSSYEKHILKFFEKVSNVTVVITGYLFPVPLKLLNLCDAIFTSAGSTWVCMGTGIPTISYDGNDFRPIGIIGRTTNNSLFRSEHEQVVELSALLNDILEQGIYIKEPSRLEMNKPDFSSHEVFLGKMFNEKEYFSFESFSLNKNDKKLSFFLRLFGAETYYNLGSMKKRWLKNHSSDR